jgi:hypothetical protein
MRCWKSILAVVACLMGAAPATCRAGFVVTAGTEKVLPQLPLGVFVKFDANWTGVLATIAGGTVGTKDNLASVTPAGAPTANSGFEINNPPDFAGKYDGAKVGPIPKFIGKPPMGTTGSGSMTVTAGNNPDTTKAQAKAGFSSGVGFFGQAFPNASAQVTRATGKSPAGFAFASSEDPWFFTPDTSSQLRLTIGLQDVSLAASAAEEESAVGMIHSFGSFGVDGTAGFQALASWDFLKEVSGNNSFSLSSITLVDQISGKPLDGEAFQLSSGVMYQLTADLQLGAEIAPVPEPAAAALFSLGTLGLIGYARRRRRTAARIPFFRRGLWPAVLATGLALAWPTPGRADFMWVDPTWTVNKFDVIGGPGTAARPAFGNVTEDLADASGFMMAVSDPNTVNSGGFLNVSFSRQFKLFNDPQGSDVNLSGTLSGTINTTSAAPAIAASSNGFGEAEILQMGVPQLGITAVGNAIAINDTDNTFVLETPNDAGSLPDGIYSVSGSLRIEVKVNLGPVAIASADTNLDWVVGLKAQDIAPEPPAFLQLSAGGFVLLARLGRRRARGRR